MRVARRVQVGAFVTAGALLIGAMALAQAQSPPPRGDPLPDADQVEPVPESVLESGGEAVFAEFDAREEAWTDEVEASNPSTEEIEATIEKIDEAILASSNAETDWLIRFELWKRAISLCSMLSEDHALRGGELCA